ncbi:hypothetical protein Ciccas_010717 [Cichlidogyrus casuarinus]|uniref:F-box domain-containing protein n=1 Tax=Cichlidogyrus casuarinus TaxID=1844966 RepID=A0ABD2PUI7_9PLAT
MPGILFIPDDLFVEIFSYLSYAEVSKLREVSSGFNRRCKEILNRGFRILENDYKELHKEIKAQMPKRLSQRRDHPLAHHADILSSVQSRIAVLDLSIMRYTRNGYFCFFPGRILDELISVKKRIIKPDDANLRLEIITDLRDLTSLAIEYFNENILPLENQNRGVEHKLPPPVPDHTILSCERSFSDSDNKRETSLKKSISLTAELLVDTRAEVRKLRKEYSAVKELNAQLQTQLLLQNDRIARLEKLIPNGDTAPSPECSVKLHVRCWNPEDVECSSLNIDLDEGSSETFACPPKKNKSNGPP